MIAKGVETRDGVAVVQLGDTLLVMWKAPASMDRWRFQVSRWETMAASRPDGVVCLDLVLEGSDPPDAALRQQMQVDLRRLGTKIRRFVLVPLGGSFWLRVVRTIVRGILMLSGQSHSHRVASTIRAGLLEVRAAASPETPSIEELMRGITGLSVALEVELPKSAAA